MLKKSLISISLFCLIAIIASPVFASNIVNGTENTLNNIRGGFQNMVNDAGNSLEGARDGISNAVQYGADGIMSMRNDVGNVMHDDNIDQTRDVKTDTQKNTQTTDNDKYTTTRTSATDSITGSNNAANATVWVTLAIAGAIIVALVWYYASQLRSNRDNY